MAQAIRGAVTRTPWTPPPLRSVLAAVLVLAVLGVFGYVLQSLLGPGSHPIRKVSVEGDFRYLTPGYIQSLVADSLHGGFFDVDVQMIRGRLLEEPWIFEATVERMWPDVLRVAIVEQVPTARWGPHALLNAAADVYAPAQSSIPTGLPTLNGPIGSEVEVLARYREIAAQLRALPLEVATVSLSERGAWTVGLRDQTQLVIGRRNIEQRIARFTAVFEPWLKPQWSNIATVDLRYTNGFAVQERSPTAAVAPTDKRS